MRAWLAVLMILAAIRAGAASPVQAVAYDIEPFELAQTHELKELLATESATLRRALAEKGLAVVDTRGKAEEISEHQPLSGCSGCDLAIARALGGDVVVTTTVQEIEYPVYNLFATVRDVSGGRVLRKAVVSIEGLEREDWDRGIGTLVKERLLARPLPADAASLQDMVARLPVPPE